METASSAFKMETAIRALNKGEPHPITLISLGSGYLEPARLLRSLSSFWICGRAFIPCPRLHNGGPQPWAQSSRAPTMGPSRGSQTCVLCPEPEGGGADKTLLAALFPAGLQD
jgi:hypothetical protein